MKKQQLILLGAGLFILFSLLFFGKTVAKKDATTIPVAGKQAPTQSFDINSDILKAKKTLNVTQLNYVNKIENSVSRGDIKDQQILVFDRLAAFWDDSVHQHDLHIFYTSESAKLVNSEKSLTFAARLMLNDLRNEPDLAKRGWKSEQAIAYLNKQSR